MLVVQVFIDVQLECMLAVGLLISLVCKTSIRGIVNCLCSQAAILSLFINSAVFVNY